MDIVDSTAEFHGVQYFVRASADSNSLLIEVEQESNNERWCGNFSAEYVEEICAKTGNFKKFAVFVRMLATAFARNSESVFVDLLTYADLELLKSRKPNGSAVNSEAGKQLRKSNKRYMILTYAVEFDRVHFPLPLAYQAQPPPEALQRTISRLREQLVAARNGDINPTEAGTGAVAASHSPTAAHDAEATSALEQQYDELFEMFESQKDELEQVSKKAKSLTSQLQAAKRHLSRDQGLDGGGNADESEALRKKLASVEKDLAKEKATSRRQVTTHRKETQVLKREIETGEAKADNLRNKGKELARKLTETKRELTKQKTDHAQQARGRPSPARSVASDATTRVGRSRARSGSASRTRGTSRSATTPSPGGRSRRSRTPVTGGARGTSPRGTSPGSGGNGQANRRRTPSPANSKARSRSRSPSSAGSSPGGRFDPKVC
jgi:coiled-coil domain-containing protein 61